MLCEIKFYVARCILNPFMQRLLIPTQRRISLCGCNIIQRLCVWLVNTSAVRLGLTHPPPLAMYLHPDALYRHPPTHSASFLTRLGSPDRVAQHKPIPWHHARALNRSSIHKRSMCFGKRPGEAEAAADHGTRQIFVLWTWLVCCDLLDIDSLCC